MPFPLEALPDWLRRMVESLARSTQTDPGMAAMFSLGVLSAAVSRRFALRTSRGINHLNLWIVVLAESGEGKSSVLGPLIEPLELIQRAAHSATATLPSPEVPLPSEPRSAIDRLLSDSEIFDGPLKLTVDPTEVLRAMQAEQERRYPGVPLNFVTRDATPQAVVEMLGNQYMAVLQASSEGGFTSWISGNPSRATGDLATLNLAWDGASQPAPGRIGREARPLTRACLGMVFSPQRESFLAATTGKTGVLLRDSGYLARFLYYVPESSIGQRKAPFDAPAGSAVDEYRARMWALLALGTTATEDVQLLELSNAASALYDAFFNELEPRLALGSDLMVVSPWIERLRQNTLRIACLLHLGEHLGSSIVTRVDERQMGDAITIARELLPYGVRAFGGELRGHRVSSQQTDQQPTDAADAITPRVLEVVLLDDFRPRSFTVREIHRRVQRGLSADQVRRALDHLVERTVLARFREGRQVMYCLAILFKNGRYEPWNPGGDSDS